MSDAHLVILFLTTVIVLSGGLMIGLLKEIQKRSQAHDSKINDEMEQDNPFSL